MNKKQLVDKVAAQSSLPVGKAQNIVDTILTSLVESGLSGEGFASPIVNVRSKTIPARVAHNKTTGKKEQVPEQKQIILRPAQKYLESIAK